MEKNIVGPDVKNYGLSLNAQIEINTRLFPAILEDPELYKRFRREAENVFKEFKIDVPQGAKFNLIETGEKVVHLFLPHQDLDNHLAELNEQLAEMYKEGEEPYVQVIAKLWGLVFVLSDQAAKDLALGQGGISTLTATIAGMLGVLPPPANALALIPGGVSAILTLQSTLISLLNHGKGVYITALWPLILNPVGWIPTPR